MAHKKSGSSAPAKRAAKKRASTKKKDEEKIDFSEIPELSNAQLMSMRRVGRPPIGEHARQLIAIRIDPEILNQLQKEAEEMGKGYQTLINEILAQYVKAAG